MNDAKQEKEDFLGYEDLISKLKSVPEEQFPDISDKVMVAVKHERLFTQQLYKRMLYTGVGVGAAALALCVCFGVMMSTPQEEPGEMQVATVEQKTASIETIVAESNGPTTIYDAVALLQLLEANEIEATDERFVCFVDELLSNQHADGFLGDVFIGGESNYNHTMATLTLIKLYESGAYPEIFTPLDAALGYIRSNQTELGGWGDIYAGSSDMGILNVTVLGLAQDLGWSDMSGHLRRGLRCLESSTDAGLSEASTIAEKLAIVQKLGKAIYAQRS